MTHIYALKIPQMMNQIDYDFLTSKISSDKRQQIAKYHRKEDAYRSLLGEALLRAIVLRKCKIPNEDIIIVKNQYGKPSLIGNIFSFNLSHSGDWVVLICGQGMVGIDVEEIRPIDINIAERFFSTIEYNDLFTKNEFDRIHYFYDLWTLKESFIKAMGTGLSTPLNSMSFRIHPDGEIGIIPNSFGLHFKQYKISQNYKLSACTSTNQFPKEITFCEVEEVCEVFMKANM